MVSEPAFRTPVASTSLFRLIEPPALRGSVSVSHIVSPLSIRALLERQYWGSTYINMEDIVMLDNGCLCCTVRGDLVRMIGELMDKKKETLTILYGHSYGSTYHKTSLGYTICFLVRPKSQPKPQPETEPEVAEVDGTKGNAPTIQHVLIVDDLRGSFENTKNIENRRTNLDHLNS
ncbi:hypothetical protein LXL04_037700 [Taraxacum kok-saghyz]